MRNRLFPMLSIAAFAAMLCIGSAQAGRSCEQKALTVASLERGLALAAKTREALDAGGHQVVILARAGQDLRRYGVRYSHAGFAYRHPDGQGGYHWRVLHKLNHCGTDSATIYRQGLGEFFLDDLWRHEAVYAVPAGEAQQALLTLLTDERRSIALHHKPYSITSYVWGRKYQQSNQWLMETLASAMSARATTRWQAQAWLQLQGYQAPALKIGALTRLGGRMGAANVAFDDHPPEKRFSDRIETVTADSVFSWLAQSGTGGAPVVIGGAE